MVRSTLSIAVIATVFVVVSAKPAYVARIPNGDGVTGVAALGHTNPSGGGPNNDFGKDFATAGEEWTSEFCQKDSDGDGQTNGQELGDPCCQWVKDSNAVVRWSTGLSHPGDATKKSDPSLWADITCGASTSNSTSSTAGSSTGTVSAGDGSSTATTDATSSSAGTSATSAASAASASTSSATALAPVMSVAGVVAAVATYFL